MTISGDVEAFQAAVLWARAHGVLLHTLTVGTVSAQLSDPAAAVNVGESASPTSVLEDYAGPTLAEAMRKMTGGDS